MWRVITLVAVLWPSHLSGWLDGAPLDTIPEALVLGLVVPALIWLYPQWLRRRLVRATIVAILLIKVVAAVAVQQDGWCISFTPPRPMVRESTGKPHAWDIRADWLADDPRCSAIMTSSYRDTFELPAWFFNLPPPDDAVVRTGFHPGEIPIQVAGHGYLTVSDGGTFELLTTPRMDVALTVGSRPVAAAEPGRHHVQLARGIHAVQFQGTMLGKEWRIVPAWNGVAMGSMRYPIATENPPSRLDRVVRPLGNWSNALLVSALVAAWLYAALARVRAPHLLVWSGAASLAVAFVAIYLPQQAAAYTAGVVTVPLFLSTRRRFMTTRGIFFLILVPWLVYAGAANAQHIGRWTLYGIGNDNFVFQRFSYRIFMQHYWLEGGQLTFWNQPFFRWIAGALHMVFGDSSVGQVYWDAAGVSIIALFAYRVVLPLAGFTWGLLAAVIPLVMFLAGPALEFVGFGLSEISSAALIYLAAFFVMRDRSIGDAITAGVLLTVAFYTRLNNLPMALAVATFALPLSVPAAAWWRPGRWLPQVRWRPIAAIVVSLAVAAALFAWRTWYYTGVFSVFHGTQREFLAVWKAGMTWREAVPAMASSVMMVLTGQDPPRLAWYSLPLAAASLISTGAVLGIRGFQAAPLPVVALFLAGLSGALVTRGWGYEGRFSIHLYGAASALCAWGLWATICALTRRPHESHSKADVGDAGGRHAGNVAVAGATRHAHPG